METTINYSIKKMNDYLPSITVQKGFFTNNFYNHKRFFSFGNNKKNVYQNYQNSSSKKNPNNLVKDHNFLLVSNTNSFFSILVISPSEYKLFPFGK